MPTPRFLVFLVAMWASMYFCDLWLLNNKNSLRGYGKRAIFNREILRQKNSKNFPCIIFHVIFGTAAALFVLPPLDFNEFGQSLLAMSIFSFNFYFDLKLTVLQRPQNSVFCCILGLLVSKNNFTSHFHYCCS